MEENKEKVSCCESKDKCTNKIHECCQNWKKCHLIKRVLLVVLIIIAFCLGSQWGQMKEKSERNYRFNKSEIMGWKYNQINDNYRKNESPKIMDEVKVIPEAPKQ